MRRVAEEGTPSNFDIPSGQRTISLAPSELMTYPEAVRAAFHELGHAEIFRRVRAERPGRKLGEAWRIYTEQGPAHYAAEEMVVDRMAGMRTRRMLGALPSELANDLRQYGAYWRGELEATGEAFYRWRVSRRNWLRWRLRR